ncbi:hypothetical protein [Streptomyces sp. NPDC059092]|uniref:hypothetical protein n=1 Tax=Streptomyces sp. NPDC059092 TaxID=3346725 RepID=UPI00368786BB
MTTTFHVTDSASHPMYRREETTNARIILVQTHIPRISDGEKAIDGAGSPREAEAMTPISRRAFVVGSSGAALAVGSPVARADHSRHRDVRGGLLDDAAMVWKRLPDSWQVPGAEQVKGEPPSQNSRRLAGHMTLIGADTADFDAAGMPTPGPRARHHRGSTTETQRRDRSVRP